MKLGQNVVSMEGADGKLLVLTPAYSAHDGANVKICLIRDGGEGGHFSEAELVEVIRQFMSERM